ncbi:MAG TPA: antitoxin [bacterium]|mgnify:CR=1 FL=1|nr:antitoxin [bacterium]
MRLDAEENEILEAFEAGALKRTATVADELKRHQAIAEATFKRDARINVRVSAKDLHALQVRAMQEGIPYQAFVAAVLHKFVDGQLIERGVERT